MALEDSSFSILSENDRIQIERIYNALKGNGLGLTDLAKLIYYELKRLDVDYRYYNAILNWLSEKES